MLWKELRECGLYAALALLAMVQVLGAAMDKPLIPGINEGHSGEIPFIPAWSSANEFNFALVAILAAILFAVQQTLWESWRQTTLFLLHRPMSRKGIYLTKLFGGTILLVAITTIPLITYILWAAAPGTHASPFYWSTTECWWRTIGICLAAYLGAFLTGIRPANWIGSKLLPLFASLIIAVGLRLLPGFPILAYLGFLVLYAALTYSIIDECQQREFP